MTTFVEKYRPDSLDEVIGNAATIKRLKNLMANAKPGQFPNCLLFAGPSGTGKTSVARLIAQALLGDDYAEGINVTEINCGTNNGVDFVREIEVQSTSLSIQGDYKVYIIDEAQEMTPAAKKGFLKVLEEARAGTIFILCSMEPGRLPDALVSRCQTFKFTFPTRDELKELITRICTQEGMMMNKKLFDLLIQHSRGNVRNFVQHLQALHQMGDLQNKDGGEIVVDEATIEQVIDTYFNRTATTEQAAIEFINACLDNDTVRMAKSLSEIQATYEFTSHVLEQCAFMMDGAIQNKDSKRVEGLVGIIRLAIRSREQITGPAGTGINTAMILLANLP